MADIILVEDGDVFVGTWAQLEDSFGIADIETLWSWCRHHQWTFTVGPMPSGDRPNIVPKELITQWSDCDWQPGDTSVLPKITK